MTKSKKFIGINHVTVIVNDKESASDFYFKKLGFEKILVGKSLWAKVGNQFIHISENSGKKVSSTFTHFAIEVEGLMSYLQKLISVGMDIFDLDDDLKKNKINIELEDFGRCYFCYDPSGNLVEFVDSSNDFFKAK